MQRTKSSSQTVCSTLRPISITSNYKFEKVQKLNGLVQQISQTHRQNQLQLKPITNLNTRQIKNGISQQILDKLKCRIKDNYDQLYTNYNDNRQKILKQIQAVETNIAGENAMNNKFDEVIKEKAKHDRLKSEVEDKQTKLRKFNQLREQLVIGKEKDQGRIQQFAKIIESIDIYGVKREEIEHQSMILQEMLKQRNHVYLNLREKYNRLIEDLTYKKQKTTKMQTINLKKEAMLNKIVEQIEKQQNVELPTKLAEELSNTIQMYQNKHSYNNIIEHEAILEEERFKKLKEQTQREKEYQRNIKLRREKDQKNSLQQLHSLYQIKSIEEEKIKKLCGVNRIQEIFSNNANLDKQNLNQLNQDICTEIQLIEEENRVIEKEMSQLMEHDETIANKNSIYQLERARTERDKEKNIIKEEVGQRENSANEWKTILQFINPLQQSFNNLISTFQKQYYQKNTFIEEGAAPIKQQKNKKIAFDEREESQSFQ